MTPSVEQDVDEAVLAELTAGLSDEQLRYLLAPLHAGRVRQHKGNSHLEAWDVRRNLLRVFGWGGWSFEVRDVLCILDRSAWPAAPQGQDVAVKGGRHSATYRVTGRLTIHGQDGRPLAVFEDGAVGDSQNQVEHGAAHDQALKTAMSQALKRCAVNLGDQFGLSLYLKGWEPGQVVVGRSLAHTLPEPAPSPDGPAQTAVVDDVTSGELDEQERPDPEEAAALSDLALDSAEAYLEAMREPGRSVGSLVALRRAAGLAGMGESVLNVQLRKDAPPEDVTLDRLFELRIEWLRSRRQAS